jgi:hypothetical protein
MTVRSNSIRLFYSPTFLLSALFIATVSIPATSSAQDQPKLATSATPAAPPTFRAGGVDLLLPTPSSDLIEAGSDNRVALEVLAPDQNRLIAAYVTADDAPRLRTGGAGMLKKYALVEVPRKAEFVDVTADYFKEVTDTMDKQFGSIVDSSVKDTEDQMNRKLKALNLDDAKITLDKPAPLGTFFSRPDAYAVGMVLPVSSQGASVKMVAGILILRVQSRLMYAYLYSVYKDEDTVKVIRKATSDWADAIQAANNK